jgi:protein phosphatase
MLDDPRAASDDWPAEEAAGRASGPGDRPSPNGHPQPQNGHRTQQERRRRRWPIVTTALVVLAAVIVGGAYVAWDYTQHQYYVGTDSGQVTIFRGVNQRVAGISLSSVYARTGITVQSVPSQELQMIQGTISATSLGNAQHIVGQVRTQVNQCKEAYVSQQTWVKNRQAQLVAARKAKVKRTPAPTSPEPTVPSQCSSASAYGLAPAPAGSAPSTSPSAGHSVSSSPSPRSTR